MQDESDEDDTDEEEALFDTTNFFTTEQDMLIIKYRCFQPELAMSDIVLRFHRELNVKRDVSELEERFQKLQTPEFRALFVLYLRAVAMAKDPNYYSHSHVLPQYLGLLQSTRSSCETRLFQLMYDDEKFISESTELISVEITSRHFPKYTRLVSKAQLRRCSKAIDALFQNSNADVVASPHQAFTLYGERLHLTDVVAHYDYCMVYNHLEQPIFDRLLQFAKDSNVMERLALLKQQQVETSHIKKESLHLLHTIFETQKKRQVDDLEAKRRQEVDKIKHQLEKTLEEDIQYIRKMHEVVLNHETAKIDAKYDELLTVLNDKIQEMREEVFELHKTCESNGWHGLERDLLQTSLQVEKVFGTSDYLIRLLILAEDLEAEPLRRALIQYLCKDQTFPQFALRRELTSKVIPETTILSILKGISTTDLRELESLNKKFVYHELVTREMHTRRVSFSSENPRKPAPEDGSSEFYGGDFELHLSAVRDFPEILEQEFARRREFSCVKMNSADMEHEVSFSEEDCVLQLEASHRYCTVFATKERKQGESGKWMFEVTVEAFDGDGESILIGWEVPRGTTAPSNASKGPSSDTNTTAASKPYSGTLVPGLAPTADGKSFGVTWQSDGGLDMGMLHANGQSKSGVACFRAGDVIGCTINQDDVAPLLRFYLNGVMVLPSLNAQPSVPGSERMSLPSSLSFGIAVQNPAYCLLPVVSMYSSRKKPLMKDLKGVLANERALQLVATECWSGALNFARETPDTRSSSSNMGVNGLLPALKSVMDRVHISKYTGKIVGIDAAGWLYKGCYSCAREVVLGLPTDSYLNYCIQQIKVLQEHEVTPIFVFDVAPLPAKRELNLERQRHRATWKEKCLEMDGDGKTKEAFAAFAKAVSVSNDMTMELIEVLRRMKIDFVVAPYEADAQLAYLSRTRTVDAVISEDSDTIPYGCKTVLFKWNSDGWATEFKRRSLGANEDFSFMGWTEEMHTSLLASIERQKR
ncbi:TPA: LOW QUALITY PROTEIN: hypothetical protein N0F65_002088 [Lagenidium giganteum]|uniref:Exonuclease 1 n=1 Tax=Lagenidium giganteum TaxID=4803 RepID=A0AAV2ZDH7_9STRA|nr:TPA: LOW QUALITY PROTEIN: hypothetical protein N0F65_002088 [Lagenidium giganteum]